MINLYTVVRLRILYGKEPEEIMPLILPYGLNFDLKILGSASSMSTLSEISSLLQERLGSVFVSYEEFRQNINRLHRDMLHKVWYGYPFSISIIFSLLRLKEIEAGNLMAVAEGIHHHLPQEEIETMLLLQK